ncbi:MAG: tetratricopeptide repeat protein [Saprospiraceae bacterium]
MKKLFLLLLVVAFASGVGFAQKELGNAKKAFSAYNLDPTNNKAKLKEAKDQIDAAMAQDANKALAEAWIKKGEIYNEIATQIVTIKQLGIGNVDELPKVEGDPAHIAAEAFQKGFDLAQKKFEKKDALRGLQGAQGNLNNLGFNAYEAQQFETAFTDFKKVMEIHDVLKANAEESALKTEDDYNNQLYITGLAALNSSKAADAKPFFQKLYDIKYDKPAIYEAMYEIASKETNPEQAYAYLETGRTKYPDDVSLLFADINHHLRTNKLDVLIGKLETAISKEPDNVTLYTTMGSVYDNLYQREFEAGNLDKSNEYFNKAKEYFEKALQKDPSNFDAIYSVGALYYNRAAVMTKDLNKLSEDYSKEGIKKYEAKRKEIFDQFDQALPYFQRAEKINPNDLNTLIALKEIYAKKDDLNTSNEFKKRLETVQGGGKVDKSYFN